MISNRPRPAATTGIGSLPYISAEAALASSLRMDIPYLPQLPGRSPREFMVAQTLDGLPGLICKSDGAVAIEMDTWRAEVDGFTKRLEAATQSDVVLETFEPSPEASICWKPFVTAIQTHGCGVAKFQLAGPMTAQWALGLETSSPLAMQIPELVSEHNSELNSELNFKLIFKLIYVKALAMAKRLLRAGVEPLLYLDEPGLYALSMPQAKSTPVWQALERLISNLRQAGVQVGIHCCSEADWSAVLNLPLQVLSIDASLSLDSLLKCGEPLRHFINKGGRLSLGVIPTDGPPPTSAEPASFAWIQNLFETHWRQDPRLTHQALHEAWLTPACGLARQDETEAERILVSLAEIAKVARNYRSEAHAKAPNR